MNIQFRGVRGSIPTFNPETKTYGGNTSCIEVEEDGWLLVLDAGSGIQNINKSPNLDRQRIDILLTHLHIDHIQGLGFFQPLFDPAKEVHIWGPASSSQSLRARLGRYLSPPLFPVYFRNLNCQLFIHEIENSMFEIGPFTIQSRYIIHPGPTVGYRLKTPQGVLAFLPDHEPALGRNEIQKDLNWLSGSELALNADILIHDAQYTSDEYAAKVGWGHSSLEDALEFAAVTKVGKLYLMHHDPMHTDSMLDNMYNQLKETSTQHLPFEMATEGTLIRC
ncbi:MAG TPA: MBL fold metallo-hydrolase [Saprospiraceae bacterium]|nr:MBL fold metallo-hydrolase [Saprospiraceae bacterium]